MYCDKHAQGFEEDEEEGFGEKMSDSEGSTEDSEEGPPSSENDESMDQSGNEFETSGEETSDGAFDTQNTIERLKDDLFADDDDDDDKVAGPYIYVLGPYRGLC